MDFRISDGKDYKSTDLHKIAYGKLIFWEHRLCRGDMAMPELLYLKIMRQ